MAVSGMFDSAKGQVDLGADGRRIDVGNPGFEVAHRLKRTIHIFRVESCRKSILDSIGYFDRLLKTGAFEKADYRAKDLLPGNAHLWPVRRQRSSARRSNRR